MMTNYYVITGERRQLIFKFKQMNCGHHKSWQVTYCADFSS